MWPPKREVGVMARSRFTRAPGRNDPRLLRSRVSGERSAEKDSALISRAVRQTPLTAMLSPSWSFGPSVVANAARARKTSLAPPEGSEPRFSSATVPTSSMIPVNIVQVSFDGKVRAECVVANAMDRQRIPHGANTPATRQGQRIAPAENFRRVVEEHFIYG